MGKKLWPGQDVNRQTDRQGDSYNTPKLLFVGAINTNRIPPLIMNNLCILKGHVAN